MSTGLATFRTVPGPGAGPRLTMATAYFTAQEFGQESDESPWGPARNARGALEAAVQAALAEGGAYPEVAGDAMRSALGWSNGLAGLLRARPAVLKLTVSYEACALLPEMVPVDGGGWLDTLLPIYRSLDRIEQTPVKRRSEPSLAILFQEEEIFSSLAEQLQRGLDGELIVDTFEGSLFADSRDRFSLLLDVFNEHRAVLFLGHLHRGGGTGGGWQLTQDVHLPMEELKALLGGPGAGRRSTPEVVFANCCSSAWEDPGTADPAGRSYPKLFLDAGVRFFVGTWTDVVLSANQLERDLAALQTLLSGFFRRWGKSPERAVEHLFEAKRECGFPLLTGLYQIYSTGTAPVSTAPAATMAAAEPVGALVSGLSPGDRLGSYLLRREMWVDPFSRTFWAEVEGSGVGVLVEVLVDEWQNSPGLATELQAAIGKLKAAGLGEGHLVPERWEEAMLSHHGQERQELQVLVYPRPAGEGPESWSTLADRSFDRTTPQHAMAALDLGAAISLRLSELHEQGLRHGNLYPGSVVFLRQPDGAEELVLKGSWARHARPGLCIPPRYAAPEEAAHEQGIDELKYDGWGLGVILFEIATGRSPFGESSSVPPESLERATEPSPWMPEALGRIIRECLLPSAKLRPAAGLVAQRLRMASDSGGDSMGEFETKVNLHLQAGHRLLSVIADDLDEVETALAALPSRLHPVLASGGSRQAGTVRYRLYVAAEERGLVDHRTGRAIVPWQSAAALRQIVGPSPSPSEVADANATLLFNRIRELRADPGEIPIVLIRGSRWWDLGPPAWRWLKICQSDRAAGGPAFVLADRPIILPEELARYFTDLFFPSPSPASLFESILSLRRELLVPGSEEDEETAAAEAIDLAIEFFPCSRRELIQALRLCALRYGAIDRRALLMRDEERQRFLVPSGVADFTPVSRLGDGADLGLPPPLEAQVASWVRRVRASPGESGPAGAPRRVLISGPGGCGKTSLARALAARIGRPLVRIEASRCLHGGLGESEASLRIALQWAGNLQGCVALFDDIDRFFSEAQAPLPAAATMQRMSSIVLNWLDTLPPGAVAVVTATYPELLPGPWHRRLELRLELTEPTTEEERRAVFAAVFRRFGLASLASDGDLLASLAHRSAEGTVLAPFARMVAGTALGGTMEQLTTPAEIEHWVQETILLHGRDTPPEDSDFWYGALAGTPASIAQEESRWPE
jgi:ATPase family protein associated with various cellular activities (AAA)